MVDFYKHVLSGKSRSEALRDAQLAMKEKYPNPQSCVFLDKFAYPLPEEFIIRSKELIDIVVPENENDLR